MKSVVKCHEGWNDFLKTRSRELVECYKSLMAKFPEEAKRYHVDFCIECAEGFLEDADV